MARPRSSKSQSKGKGTSFGKKSDAEKSFKKRGPSRDKSSDFSRPEGSRKPKGFGKPSGYRSTNTPPRTSPGRSAPESGGRRGDFSAGRGFKRDDDRAKEKPVRRSSTPFSKPTDERPKRFSGTEGSSFKRPFKKEGPRFAAGRDKGAPKEKFEFDPHAERPKRDDGFKKPFRDKSGDFEKKSFDKSERKSFVQSRISSSDFTRPGKKDKEHKDVAPEAPSGLTRLNKYIANSGVGSRREADKLITMGLISVNGTVITELGSKVKPGDVIRYEDKILKAEKPVYILLNKPKGFITTTDDPQERNTVMGLIAGACKERVYPVGRLDRNTTGILLITNDGDLTDKLTHPSYKAKKVYKVELDKPLTKTDFQKIAAGVHLEEGRAMVDDIAIISEDNKTVGLEIHIGWNRVVRRIFESLEYQVVRLDRSVYAGLDKKDLQRGQWRFLKPEEIVRLKHFK